VEFPKSLMLKIKKKLPELCSVADLMKFGIFNSEQAAYSARKYGSGPQWFRLPHRGIVYPREQVIEYLISHASKTKVARCLPDTEISKSEVPPLTQNRKDRPT
jgi:hypothetical protein